MSQTDLPRAGFSLVLSAPPETDSSADAVGFPPSEPAGHNQGLAIVPEMTVGSPKKEAKIEAEKINSPVTRNQSAEKNNVSLLKDYQPQRQLNPPLTNQIPSGGDELAREDKRQYWKTEIIPTAVPAAKMTATPPSPPPIPIPLIPPEKAPILPKPTVELKVVKEVPKVGIRGTIVNEEEIRPARVTVVSILFLLMSGFYGVLAWVTSLAVRWLNTAVNGLTKEPIDSLFIKNFPEYSLMPLAIALASATLWWIGIDLKQGTKKGAWKGLVASLFWPLLIFGLNQWVGVILTRFLSNPQLLTSLINTSGFDLRGLLPIYSAQIAFIIGAGMILMAWVGFKYPSKKKKEGKSQLVKWVRWGLVTPVVVYLGLVNWLALDKDMNFQATSKEAGFHVYRINDSEKNWQQVAKFKVNQSPSSLLIGRDDFVETGYDLPLTLRIKGRASQMVVVRQIDVPSGFEVNSFAQNLIEGAQVKDVQLGRSASGKGVFLEKSEGTGKMTVLTLTTGDNVLLLLSSKGAGINDLIDLANKLN